MLRLRGLVVLLFMFLTAGCLPYPHLYPRLPNVSGKIADHGSPLEGVQVSLGEISERGSCEPMKGPVSSATDGTFSIEGAKRLRFFFFLLPGDSIEKWAVCIKTKDKEALTYSRQRVNSGPLHSPESVKLFCDLSSSKLCEVTEETLAKSPYGDGSTHRSDAPSR